MNKPILITLGALLRRLATTAGVAVLALIVDHWTHWLKQAMEGDTATAAWLPIAWLLVEGIQKFLRERKKLP